MRLFIREKGNSKENLKKIIEKEGLKVISMRENIPGLEDCFVEILALRDTN